MTRKVKTEIIDAERICNSESILVVRNNEVFIDNRFTDATTFNVTL